MGKDASFDLVRLLALMKILIFLNFFTRYYQKTFWMHSVYKEPVWHKNTRNSTERDPV